MKRLSFLFMILLFFILLSCSSGNAIKIGENERGEFFLSSQFIALQDYKIIQENQGDSIGFSTSSVSIKIYNPISLDLLYEIPRQLEDFHINSIRHIFENYLIVSTDKKKVYATIKMNEMDYEIIDLISLDTEDNYLDYYYDRYIVFVYSEKSEVDFKILNQSIKIYDIKSNNIIFENDSFKTNINLRSKVKVIDNNLYYMSKTLCNEEGEEDIDDDPFESEKYTLYKIDLNDLSKETILFETVIDESDTLEFEFNDRFMVLSTSDSSANASYAIIDLNKEFWEIGYQSKIYPDILYDYYGFGSQFWLKGDYLYIISALLSDGYDVSLYEMDLNQLLEGNIYASFIRGNQPLVGHPYILDFNVVKDGLFLLEIEDSIIQLEEAK